jgi:hypothetical protein
MEPIKLNINLPGGEKLCIVDVDPFNDTIADIKNRLGPDDLDVLPVHKQRLMYMNEDLDDQGETAADSDGEEMAPPSRTLFECNIKNMDTIDLEKSKIDVTIKQPNGECFEVENVDPRNDTLDALEAALSDKYYDGKDKDGTIPEDQLRPLKFNGDQLPKGEPKSLREYGIMDDGDVIEIEPITIYVEFGPDEGDTGHGTLKTMQNIDPMNHMIRDAKALAASKDTLVDKLILLHKEADMKELEDTPNTQTFYDNGIKDGDTLVIKRKPITLTIKLPKDDDGNGPSTIIIKANPDEANLITIRQAVFDKIGFPMDSQKLNKILNGTGEKERLEAPGDTKLSSPELNVVDDCTIELEPMTINIKTETGKVIPLQVSPSDIIKDVKKKLAKGKIKIPFNKQRLVMDDGTEIGGDEDNEKSLGNDEFTLADLGVKDGSTFCVEKSKISLRVKMPKCMDDVEVVVDPKNDSVDTIRKQLFDATGLPKEYQQRFIFKDESLDNGYNKGDGEGDTGAGRKRSLAEFGLKELDCITLDATRVYIMRIPEKKKFVIEGINPLNDRLIDLKLRVTAEICVPPFKQRLLNPETDDEYVGNKDSTEKLHEYGIQDGDVINVELSKLNFIILLPDLSKLEMTVDPRKDDLQKVRDHVFKKYYNNRKIPKDAMRQMMKGPRKVWDDEPGEKKLIELGVIQDEDHVNLKPCSVRIETPTRIIYCPNADPFRDTLKGITDFVKHVGINVDGCHILFKKQKMTDYSSVLYDLNIGDEDTVKFVK